MVGLMRVAPTILAGLLAMNAFAQEERVPIAASDLLRINEIDQVAVSPAGRTIAYTVRAASPSPKEPGGWVYRNQIYVVSAARSEEPRQLTYGEEDAVQPAWHPGGDLLAFVRKVEGVPQIFVLPYIGGESYQLTDILSGATHPRWSPDGSRILFTSSLPAHLLREQERSGQEASGEQPLIGTEQATRIEADPDGDLLEVRKWLQQHTDVNPAVNLSGTEQSEQEYLHLFAIEAQNGSEPVQITQGFYSFPSAVWAPDGESIIASRVRSTSVRGETRQHDLVVIRADGSGVNVLLGDDRYDLLTPSVSPDGQILAFVGRTAGYRAGKQEIGLLNLRNPGEPEWITEDFPFSAENLQWSDDGWRLYFLADTGSGFSLFRAAPFEGIEEDTIQIEEVPLDSVVTDSLQESSPEVQSLASTIERLTGDNDRIRSFDSGEAAVFYILSEDSNPFELYASNSAFTTRRPLTAHNSSWLQEKTVSLPESYRITGEGLDVSYRIYKPPTHTEGETHPLLVSVCGAPTGRRADDGIDRWFERQFLTSRGYGILTVCPGGTSGSDSTIFSDWEDGPAGVLAAVTRAASELPWVDPERLVILGGNYGGYLAAWMITRENPYRAAIIEQGIPDLQGSGSEEFLHRVVRVQQERFPLTDAMEDTLEVMADSLLADLVDVYTDSTFVSTDSMVVSSDSMVVASDPMSASIDSTAGGNTVEETNLQLTLSRDLLLSPLVRSDSAGVPVLFVRSDQRGAPGAVQADMLYELLELSGRPVSLVRYALESGGLSPTQRMDRILRLYTFLSNSVDPVDASNSVSSD